MRDDWLLQWDPTREARPTVVPARAGLGAKLEVHREADGSFVAFEGWLGEPVDDRQPAARHISAAWPIEGQRVLERLRGNFVLVVWRESERTLLVARDATGPSSCWWWKRGSRFLLSASIDRLLVETEVASGLRRVVLAEHLIGAWSDRQPHESSFEDISRLPAGWLLETNGRDLSARRWFEAVATPMRWASDEEMSTFPQLLAQAVRRCLHGGADCLAMSGGYDSVSLAVLAAAEPSAAPLHALSIHFSGPVCDESEVQRSVARALGMTQTLRRLEDGLDGEDVLSASSRMVGSGPGPALSLWDAAFVALLRDAGREGRSAMMTGAGGDEMLGVSAGYGVDAMVTGRVGALASYVATCRRAYGASYRTMLWDSICRPALSALAATTALRVAPSHWGRSRRRRLAETLPGWIPDPQLRAELVERRFESMVPKPLGGAYEHEMRRVLIEPLFALEQDQSQAWARAAGFRLMTPFLDRDLVRLLLRARPHALLFSGYPKSPLRALVRERLASVELPAKKVNFTSLAHATLRGPGRDYWRRIGGARSLGSHGIVDERAVDLAMNDYFDGRNQEWTRVWLTLSAEVWLRARNA